MARLVSLPSQIEAVQGSIWNGRATLAGGHSLTWATQAPALLTGRLSGAIVLTGEGTRITGTLSATPFRIEGTGIEGRAGSALLALAEGMPDVTCTARGIVDIARLSATRSGFAADGTVQIEPGACTEPSGRETPVPAMVLSLTTEGDDALARLTSGDTLFLTARVQGDRRIALQVEPDGARNVPGLPTGAPILLDFPF